MYTIKLALWSCGFVKSSKYNNQACMGGSLGIVHFVISGCCLLHSFLVAAMRNECSNAGVADWWVNTLLMTSTEKGMRLNFAFASELAFNIAACNESAVEICHIFQGDQAR